MRSHAAGVTRSGVVVWALCAYAQVWATDGAKAELRAAAPALSNSALLDFDIPAQPLVSALNRYAAVTDRPAVFRSSLVSGRTSSPLRGAYSPEAALRILLSGTRLVAHDVGTGDTHAFVLKPVGESAPATIAAATAGMSSLPSYDGLVQATIWEDLCANPQTTPGNYRALLRFQIDAAGAVRQARLLGSTGDKGRDTAVLQTLHRVHIDQPPPPGLVQPLIMLVLPRDEMAGRACAGTP